MIAVVLARAGAGAALPSGDGYRVIAHDPSVLAGLAHGEATEQAPAYTHLVLVDCTSADDPVLTRVAAALRDADVDTAHSTVLAGEEYVVVPGDEALVLAMALTRRADLGRDEFVRHWRTTHADLGRAVPGSEGYRQLHRDDAATAGVRSVLGVGGVEYDGVALACYSSVAKLEAILANSEVTSRLLEDERRFIDHTGAAMVVGT